MSFSIVTDTSANLPSNLTKQHNITVIPFSYFVNGQEFNCIDTNKFDGSCYYNSIREGTKVTTSQISPQLYIDYLSPLLSDGKDILFIGMSSGISGSFHCAEMAAKELKNKYPNQKIHLIDTLGASLGEGILVLKAVEYKDQGIALDEIANKLKTLRHRICQVFTVEDLMYLRKSGRLSNVAAVIGTVFHINPLLKGNKDGKIVTYGKVRGRKKAIEALAERYDSLVEHGNTQIVGIAHADCLEDAEYLKSLLNRHKPPKQILTVCYEPVTGSHVGPDTLALFFESSDDVRMK